MRKIWVDWQEWYPVAAMHRKEDSYFGKECEVTEDEHEFLTAAFSDFDKAQKFLEDLYEKE